MKIQINTSLQTSIGIQLSDIVVNDFEPFFNQLPSLIIPIDIKAYTSEQAMTDKRDPVYILVGNEKLKSVSLSITEAQANSPTLLGAAYNDLFLAAVINKLGLTENDITIL